MKKIFSFHLVIGLNIGLLICATINLIYSPCQARDFIVEFVEENYKETSVANSNDPLIYHSIQVISQAGPKLLILTGDNLEYRKWLRQYIAENKKFITMVPDNDNDKFISAKAYEIDVTSLHPFNGNKWASDVPISRNVETLEETLEGDRHILVIDPNEKRSHLISLVIKKMGYTAMVLPDYAQALNTFRVHPGKFKMIIANHEVLGMKLEDIVEHILKIDHKIPILVETGYQNHKLKERFVTQFSKAGSVLIKPMVLEDLQNTIKKLVKGQA
jgi:CheY-like chemotaxis protein